MEPRLKAEELVIKYLRLYVPDEGEAIIFDNTILTRKNHFHIGYFARCALTAVDEILSFIDSKMQGWCDSDLVSYWQQVKQEIEKL